MPTRPVATIVAALALTLLTDCGRHASAPLKPANHGAALFSKNCSACHGGGGKGGSPLGPSLTLERTKKSREQIVAAIEDPEPPMPKLFPGQLSEQDVADIAAYLESL
ncbi:MAG: cytochrome c [Candidatus Eremiobacteraeota bacterium]|nr:cytochrome c [Candidatus Eremiobacteraeota bacterium]